MDTYQPKRLQKKIEKPLEPDGQKGRKLQNPPIVPFVQTQEGVLTNFYSKTNSQSTPAQLLPRLPWELERLVSAASNGSLPTGSQPLETGFVPDLERYVLAWAAAYLAGATEDATARLWDAWRTWQGLKAVAA
jgi:hypothetical protein